MLLITAVLASSLALAQDAPTAEPAGTPQEVRALLDAAQAALYDPADDGLRTLSFVLPLVEDRDRLLPVLRGAQFPEGTPERIRLAEVAVTWETGSGAEINGSMDAALPAGLAPVKPQIEAGMVPAAQQTLALTLNEFVSFTPLLENFDARFDGAEGELVKVVFDRKPGATVENLPADRMTWLFDANGLPAGSHMSFKQPGPMGVDVQIDVSTRFAWRPARGDGGPVVLASLSTTQDIGSLMLSREQQATYRHEEVGGVVLIVGYQESGKQAMAAGPTSETTNDVVLESIVVNGTPRAAN